MKNIIKKATLPFLLGGALLVSACANDATVASYNVSQAADNFEIDRRVVFYNGITNEYMMTIEGRCSIEADTMDNQLEVTCKVGPSEFKKHFLGLSDNVTYFVEHLYPTTASVNHYRVTFKPQTILPDVDLRGDVVEAVTPNVN